MSLQGIWTLSQAAAVMEASALICVAASVRKVGRGRTALSLAALMTALVRACALKGNACVTVTLEVTTALSHAALQIAQAVVYVLTASACARSPSRGKTAWLEGVSTTARIRGCASTGLANADPVMWEKTVRWSTVPTTAVRKESAKRVSVSARMASLEMTATLVSLLDFS